MRDVRDELEKIPFTLPNTIKCMGDNWGISIYWTKNISYDYRKVQIGLP